MAARIGVRDSNISYLERLDLQPPWCLGCAGRYLSRRLGRELLSGLSGTARSSRFYQLLPVHLAFLVDGHVDMPVLGSEGRNLHRPARQIKTRIDKLDLVEDQDRVSSIG